ncbi:unnamed protein product, partial [Mesorhabditis belari]|uniref:MRG domain-containing protein n=1 Tax=Mesorhabditis belari TaxID=2138241 RepID=A0AAF3FAP2_9BILA
MKWRKGDVVMVDWKGCFYKAKIIGVTESDGETHYKIHYDSWSSKWDQVIPESETDKWEAFTAEAQEAARKQIKGLKTRTKGRKRHAADGGESDATPFAPKKKATMKDATEQTSRLDLTRTKGPSDEEEMTVEVQYVNGKKVTEKTTKHEFTAFAHMVEHLLNSMFTRCLCVDQDKQQVQRLGDELLKMNKGDNDDLMKPFVPSEHFGVVYLLRLFVKIHGDSDFIDACDRYSFVKHSSDFMKHLLDNIGNYYDKDAYNETDRSDRSAA